MATAELSPRVFLPCFLLVMICLRPPLSRAARAPDTVSRRSPAAAGWFRGAANSQWGSFSRVCLVTDLLIVIHFQNLMLLVWYCECEVLRI